MKILGVDPGSTRVGYGLIKKERSELKFLSSGILKILSKDRGERLVELEKSFLELLKKERPNLAVLERLYFMRNMKTAIEVSQSRGVLTLLIVKHKIPLLEFTPLEIKQGVSGYGMADKKSITKAVMRILNIKKIHGGDDAADALAAAVMGSSYIKRSFEKK